jgi:hypothetical protein
MILKKFLHLLDSSVHSGFATVGIGRIASRMVTRSRTTLGAGGAAWAERGPRAPSLGHQHAQDELHNWRHSAHSAQHLHELLRIKRRSAISAAAAVMMPATASMLLAGDACGLVLSGFRIKSQTAVLATSAYTLTADLLRHFAGFCRPKVPVLPFGNLPAWRGWRAAAE